MKTEKQIEKMAKHVLFVKLLQRELKICNISPAVWGRAHAKIDEGYEQLSIIDKLRLDAELSKHN